MKLCSPNFRYTPFLSKALLPRQEPQGELEFMKEDTSISGPFLSVSDPLLEPLRMDEFDSIPRYLKGRLTMERINSFTTQLNRLYQDKYSILKTNPARLSPDLRNRYYLWREEENNDVQGRFFISETDLKNGIGKNSTGLKLDPANRSIIASLRHVGRLREVRVGGGVRLVLS